MEIILTLVMGALNALYDKFLRDRKHNQELALLKYEHQKQIARLERECAKQIFGLKRIFGTVALLGLAVLVVYILVTVARRSA